MIASPYIIHTVTHNGFLHVAFEWRHNTLASYRRISETFFSESRGYEAKHTHLSITVANRRPQQMVWWGYDIHQCHCLIL